MPLLTMALLQSVMHSPHVVVEKVPCPELGDDVYAYVKQLSCAEAELIERIAGENAAVAKEALLVTGQIMPRADDDPVKMTRDEAMLVLADPPTLRIPLVTACLCDEHGEPMIQTEAQRESLTRLPTSLMRRLHTAAWKLNGTGDDKVEQALKNFDRRQTNDSGIVLPVNGVAPSVSVNNS